MLATIRSRILMRLGELLDFKASQAVQGFVATQAAQKLLECGAIVDRRRQLVGDSYGCRLISALSVIWPDCRFAVPTTY
jgi:hypothetical protein